MSYIYISPYVCNGILRHWISFEYPWLFHSHCISFAIIIAFLVEQFKELEQFTVSGLCTSFPLRLVEQHGVQIYLYFIIWNTVRRKRIIFWWSFFMYDLSIFVDHFRRFQILKVRKRKNDKNCHDWYFSFLNFSEQ